MVESDRWITIYLEGHYGYLPLSGGIEMLRVPEFTNVWEIQLWLSSETLPILNNPFDVTSQQTTLYNQIAERIALYFERVKAVLCGFQIERGFEYKGSVKSTIEATFCPCWIIPTKEISEMTMLEAYTTKTIDTATIYLCRPHQARLFRVYPGPVEEILANEGMEQFRTIIEPDS